MHTTHINDNNNNDMKPIKDKNIAIWIAVIIVLILMIGFGSCTTQKRCYKKYPPQIITKDSIIYKDRTITIYDTVFIKGDTISIYDTVVVDRLTGLINSDAITADAEYAQAIAQVINSRLFLNLVQKDTAIARMLKENITEVEVYRDRVEIVEKFTTHWYDIAARWVAGIFIFIIFVGIILRYIKTTLGIM